MDIAALSMNLKQIQLQQAVGTSVLKLAMDTGKENANLMTEALAKMTQVMEQSVNPYLGVNLDVVV